MILYFFEKKKIQWLYNYVITRNKCIMFCIVCLPGHYGMDCRESCCGHCISNEPCDHVSGEWTSGCKDGFVGTLCIDCKTYLQSLYYMLVYLIYWLKTKLLIAKYSNYKLWFMQVFFHQKLRFNKHGFLYIWTALERR